jgi:cell division protein FtsB
LNVDYGIWDKLTRAVVVLLVIAGTLGIIVLYEPVVQENQRMREEKYELDKKIEAENKVARRLDVQLHSFQDPVLERTLVERLARERLTYARPGENVIHFEPPLGAAR